MNVLLLCEALAQKIVDNLNISDPSEVDFASQPEVDALLDSIDLDREVLAELTKIKDGNLP